MEFFKRIHPVFSLSLLGGFIMYASWFPNGTTVLIFFGLIPFLWLAQQNTINDFLLFAGLFAGFFLFHFFAGYWMYSSTVPGSLMAHLFNASYFAFVIWFWRFLFRKTAVETGKVFMLLSLWIAFEWLHQQWNLAWPWFTLGHVFAVKPNWVQWYAYTGVAGGTAWILLVNALLVEMLIKLSQKKTSLAFKNMMGAMFIMLIPLLISIYSAPPSEKSNQYLRVAIVQPNIHPQREKFGGLSAEDQLERGLKLASSKITPETDLLVFPETMLVSKIDENQIEKDVLVSRLLLFLKKYPNLQIFSGAYTQRFSDWHLSDAKYSITDSVAYVLYNSALLIDTAQVQIYHKNRLVPLVEQQPFAFIMKPIQDYIEKSGGLFGSYGKFNSSQIMQLNNTATIKPLICFESAFSNYAAKAKTANLIVLITNDGWWKQKGGYFQHLQLARIRAIENQRWIVRAANTGVSAVISPNGSITKSLDYNLQDVLIADVPLLQEDSFFVRFPWLTNTLLLLPGLIIAIIGLINKHLLTSHKRD